jgi:pimeloyl-ACP methyl ester carboxylesterase
MDSMGSMITAKRLLTAMSPATVRLTRKNWKFIDMLYRTWCPTWDQYDEHVASAKETLKAPGVLKSTLSYYRNSLFGLNPASFKFRRLFNGLTMEVIPSVGHFPQLENPQWISERLIGWVKQHSV